MESSAQIAAVPTRFERQMFVLGFLMVAGFAFLPLLLVSGYVAGGRELSSASAESMVGTGVLLRVAFRRVFRTAARSLFQTTLGTFSRASARTITRRIVRLAVKSTTVMVKDQMKSGDETEDLPRQSATYAIALASVALAMSFYGVLWVIGPVQSAPLIEHLSPIWLAILSAIPMAIFSGLALLASRWQRVEVRFHTAWDGVILQAYFTGAGSFLPLTTDVEYFGERRATGNTALCVLGGLLSLHWILFLVGRASGIWAIEYLGVITLIYGFVYSFPLRPLDGHYLWCSSKWQWAIVWLAMLYSFVTNVSDSIQGIL